MPTTGQQNVRKFWHYFLANLNNFVSVRIGKKHPDQVVETASLSSVEPSDINYKLALPADIIDRGLLSALQLEAITYTCQAHEHFLEDGSRAGFLVGDGAGVGKGRTIAGIIYENYLRGRKRALWISVSNDLKYDAQRDLKDIGAKVQVHALNKFKYAKINSVTNGNVKKGIVFSTYSAMIGESNNRDAGKYKSRLKQLLQWCGEDFEGVIVFDECHKAKNLCPTGSSKPTKTGLTALELQNKLPKARVVYASATGASEPKNMAYMVRLGIWGKGTPFAQFNDFIVAVEKRGVGAMELVAMDMKLRGGYIARQLSFQGVTFKIDEVQLTKDFKEMYDESVELWVEAMHKFTEAAELISAESRMRKTMWGQFWSAHQRFFKYLCIASKVQHAVTVAREAIKYGKCIVIGLQSTGEARTLEQLERDEGELSDFVSTAKGVFQSLIEKHFPAPNRETSDRIKNMLGIKTKTEFERMMEAGNGLKITGGQVNNKRKTIDLSNLPQKRVKRSQLGLNDDDADDFNSGGSNAEEKSSESSSENESDSDASEENSDYNPFGNSDDSDADPWVKKKSKNGKKQKKEKKKKKSKEQNGNGHSSKSSTADVVAQALQRKPQAVQEKIQEHLKAKNQAATLPGMIKIEVPGMGNIAPIHIKPSGSPHKSNFDRACEMKEMLLRKIEELGNKLPPNTLDQLIDELGGPENVAEMTGRKGRVVQNEDGSIQYESRSEQDVPLETLNLTEKKRFMDGLKDVAIISEAASSGISLQSDRRERNQRKRVHITLELPWSADRAIQQFGRTHRSNQVSAPEYIFLISDLAGERRFASTVAKRLESLGALTHGDRRATETRDLSQFNIDNKFGRSALEAVMKTIMGYEAPMVPPPADYKGDFFTDIAGALVGVGLIVNSETNPGILSLDKDYNSISKFLNRILGMPVELQNRLFKYFTDTLAAVIVKEKRMGRFDLGILDVGAGGNNAKRIRNTRFLRKHSTGIAPIELQTVHIERGMIWQEAMDKWADLEDAKEGFYLSHLVRNGSYTAILAIAIEDRNSSVLLGTETKKVKLDKKKEQMFQIFRPNTGAQVRLESLTELEKKYKKVDSSEADKHWIKQYDASLNTCSHAFWSGACRHGSDCEVRIL